MHLLLQHYSKFQSKGYQKESRRMVSLNCLSINKLQILASTNKTSSPSTSHQGSPPKRSHPTIDTGSSSPTTSQPPSIPRLKQKRKQKQPSILEIERAVSAGSFRDTEPVRDPKEKMSLFGTPMSTESPVEKQLRETGEWIADKTEASFRSAGKPILMFTFQWMLPLWLFAFFVASGIIKLPFDTPLLDDFIM
nr:probable NAD(P)H dehydrogenase subunit CRR3, chloroplastic [Coffea arabica]